MIQTLSDGERQKVMIAKALAQETPVIYLDEPTAFLDYPSKVEMMQLLFKLSRETDKTIFLSTHDLELALQIADKLWLMDKQKGVRIGAPEDLSLDGSLGSYFARKGIVFDAEIGLFRVENEYTRKIGLKGEGTRLLMVNKALKRIGIQGDVKEKCEEVIEILPDCFVLHQGNSKSECTYIADLLDKLK
jgi:iron complex transport system ATP-binding protein